MSLQSRLDVRQAFPSFAHKMKDLRANIRIPRMMENSYTESDSIGILIVHAYRILVDFFISTLVPLVFQQKGCDVKFSYQSDKSN